MSSQVAKAPANSKNKKNNTENKNNNRIPQHIDDKAAAIILQRYLDKINRKQNTNNTQDDNIQSLEELESGGFEI
ncbi:MAG: hypothetical protein ORN26_00985 [Candidatus Pacebacteria bacterium]|nr:hypothetical protein [Candidatus Paceibacterota bacterium]